ncbi:hypothetical protein GPALN_013104 [Globodera pallida]|nr:hypothetical protein GPALN_013104 [Globodera pallida]
MSLLYLPISFSQQTFAEVVGGFAPPEQALSSGGVASLLAIAHPHINHAPGGRFKGNGSPSGSPHTSSFFSCTSTLLFTSHNTSHLLLISFPSHVSLLHSASSSSFHTGPAQFSLIH